jgi:hypothetical protein
MSFEHRIGARWRSIAVVAALSLLGIATIVNRMGVSRLERQIQSNALDAQLTVLRARVDQLDQRANAQAQQPASVSQADFAAANQVLENRLARLQEAQVAGAPAIDLQALQKRVGIIETRLKKTTQELSAAHRRASTTTTPIVPSPPFRILAMELRGGERFVSIIAGTATSLADVRLLRVGDAEGGWQLQSIEAHEAVFHVNGQTLRVAVP